MADGPNPLIKAMATHLDQGLKLKKMQPATVVIFDDGTELIVLGPSHLHLTEWEKVAKTWAKDRSKKSQN